MSNKRKADNNNGSNKAAKKGGGGSLSDTSSSAIPIFCKFNFNSGLINYPTVVKIYQSIEQEDKERGQNILLDNLIVIFQHFI